MNTVASFDDVAWAALHRDLDAEGVAVMPAIFNRDECIALRARFDADASRFRAVIDMARHNFGVGRYKYFDYPLPAIVQGLRETLYPPLARIANRWAERLGQDVSWPESHAALLERCRRAGQCRPTPLLLRYGQGGYNRLHQDIYGPVHFPLQVIVQLSAPGREFEGGELVLVEQRPRVQTRPLVVRLEQGNAAVIPVRERPCRGTRGDHKVQMRHGVARLARGERTTLGIIFHDAA